LEQARRKLGVILWRDSVIFGENFSDGRILSAILLELRSKSSHLGRRVLDITLWQNKQQLSSFHYSEKSNDKKYHLPGNFSELEKLPGHYDLQLAQVNSKMR
jgi:hypothetical protein